MALRVEEAGNIFKLSSDFTSKFEGLRLEPYLDITGIKTFGYGSLCSHYPNITFPITEEFARECLQQDLVKAYQSVSNLITVSLNGNQRVALMDFVYNLGGSALQRSTLRRKINRGESPKGEWQKWCFAAGKKSKGLLKRRLAEKALYNL